MADPQLPIQPGGMGLCAVSIEWVRSWLDAYGETGSHLDAFFHQGEQAYCRAHRFSEERWAARIAAKRAVQRVRPVRCLDITVGRTEHGAPTLTIQTPSGPERWLISLTHERSQGADDPGWAVALVVCPS